MSALEGTKGIWGHELSVGRFQAQRPVYILHLYICSVGSFRMFFHLASSASWSWLTGALLKRVLANLRSEVCEEVMARQSSLYTQVRMTQQFSLGEFQKAFIYPVSQKPAQSVNAISYHVFIHHPVIVSLVPLRSILLPHTQPIPYPILFSDHPHRQAAPDAKEHKRCPLPAKWIDDHAKDEPIDELRVCEKVKRSHRRPRLEQSGHVNPLLHPVLPRSCERVYQEDKQEPGVDADMPRAYGTFTRIRSDSAPTTVMQRKELTDSVQISAVDSRDFYMLRRENLQVPCRRPVLLFESIIREEAETGTVVASCHDDHVSFDFFLDARSIFWYALEALVKQDSVLCHPYDISAKPGRLAPADLAEDLGVDHGSPGKETFLGGCQVTQVAIEEQAQEGFGNPGKDCLLAEDIPCEDYVDKSVARDYPFVGAGEDRG